MTLLFVLGGCRGTKPPSSKVAPVAEETITKVVAILRGPGDDALVHQEGAALKATIARMAETSNGIKSVDDLARAGRRVSVEEILQAAQRERSLQDKISGELTRIAKNVDPSQPIDFGAAVVEAHCGGLKHELTTGKPPTVSDYTIYFVLELAESQIPTPPSKQIREVADSLIMVANDLYALTMKDEAARLAYVKEMCKIP